MATCLLVIYWPDFAESSRGARYSPALVARCAMRRLALRCARVAGYAWARPDDANVERAFRRWGLRASGEWFGAETVRQLLEAHPNVEQVVLAMDHARAAEIHTQIASPSLGFEVWTPDGEEFTSAHQPVRALADVLHLATAHPVGLFVNSSAVQFAVGEGSSELIAQSCLRRAELVGAVVMARWYAPGRCFEFAGTAPDPLPPLHADATNGSVTGASLLHADLRELLDDPLAPRTWIVVSDVPLPNGLIQSAHERGIRVVLWPATEEELPLELRTEADACISLSTVLDRQLPPPGPAARAVSVDAESLSIREAVLPEISTAGARLGPWVRLIYHTECLLRQGRSTRLPVRKLALALAELEEFGPTPSNAMGWINRARAEGALVLEPEWHRGEPGSRITVCRTNGEHPLVQAAVEVPDRCLRLLNQMLQKIPWVSFKLLRNVLLREQWLGGSPYELDGAGIDEWLNFLIQDSAIRMTKEPNLVNPDYPVTALRLNHEHPLSRSVVAEAVEGTRLAAERAILAVDHFMTRNRKPWMAMGALRRALETMGREELQAVLQGLQNLGALVTESYPNPQKEHCTTGCRLKVDEPLVVEALSIRDSIIRVTQEHQSVRNWVSLSQVAEDLNQRCGAAPSPAYRVAWFLLLRDEGILELDHDGHLPGAGWENVRCRLNMADAVVRAAIEGAAPVTEAHPGQGSTASAVAAVSETWSSTH